MTIPDIEPLTRDNWPIAAAMINFPSVLADGTTTQDQDAEGWAATLEQVADAGFTEFDPTDSWLRVADLSPSRLQEFLDVVKSVGLTIPAISTARRSVVDPDFGDDYLKYGHRVIDTAAAIGAAIVSFGFFRALTPAQRNALWFWTVQGPVDSFDPVDWDRAVRRTRELGEHAAQAGIAISLEMYEDTYLGSADSSVKFVRDVDHPAVGLNPDLGNLQRLHRPVERWEVMAEKTLPYVNYWHVKNYFRTEDGTTGAIVTAPAPLELGVINYRKAVQMAIEKGFRGAFCTEHYGGDGLSVSATNREYLRRILPKSC
ncbi:sugar phosphate isomerase/epimerase family protein [Mycolicibacterium mageritense]|uniref:sugar phosphate isomerase/epimerase family protein n=1 Tax=Mycolicibacterium mageritense TaxID=53462 RepID=UPI0011DA9BB9|nr:sugar phosphate isomerase/epimerase family protein [Mycolicibacterium mageritense]TXI64378.1 MAG: sugar phosphate isomerase/epimerase [Mycolicibacterium mageritense]